MARSFLLGVTLTTTHFPRYYLVAIDPRYSRHRRGARDEGNARRDSFILEAA